MGEVDSQCGEGGESECPAPAPALEAHLMLTRATALGTTSSFCLNATSLHLPQRHSNVATCLCRRALCRPGLILVQ